MNDRAALVRVFALQAEWGKALGSPFTEALMQEAVRDLEAGGPIAAIVDDWPGDPVLDALPTRFAGALHAAILQGRAPDLAAEYPAARADWDMARVWPLARAFIAREPDWVRAFIQSPPQTNETRRAIGLLPGFLALAKHGPLHLLELGASAGLNQAWDKFSYRTASWRWGEGDPCIDTDWRGPPPADLDAEIVVASRAGCDRNPLDVHNADDVLRVRAFLWPDQPARRVRLDAAIALARTLNVRIDRAEVGPWLQVRLAGDLPTGATVIYHSVVQQYFDAQTTCDVTAAIEEAGARADNAHRLAWLRYELNSVLGIDGPHDGMAVELRTWPGNDRRMIVRTDSHANWVDSRV